MRHVACASIANKTKNDVNEANLNGQNERKSKCLNK